MLQPKPGVNMPVTAHKALIIIGHRGASGYRPEHTLASYELAIQMGWERITLNQMSF
jgi:glycerophosphoryl diester phosphodiesterase